MGVFLDDPKLGWLQKIKIIKPKKVEIYQGPYLKKLCEWEEVLFEKIEIIKYPIRKVKLYHWSFFFLL